MGEDTHGLRTYHQWAIAYDLASAVAEPLRRRAVELLSLEPGSVVLDVGCGTGLCFEPIQDRIGPRGRVIGIDASAEMLTRARRRVERHGWANVTLLCAPVERAPLPAAADAALFCLVHDILRCRGALQRVLRHLKPGATVVAAGSKWAPWWAPSVNATVWLLNRPYVCTFRGFQQPWQELAALLADLEVQSLPAYLGGAFVAWGTVPPRQSLA